MSVSALKQCVTDLTFSAILWKAQRQTRSGTLERILKNSPNRCYLWDWWLQFSFDIILLKIKVDLYHLSITTYRYYYTGLYSISPELQISTWYNELAGLSFELKLKRRSLLYFE